MKTVMKKMLSLMLVAVLMVGMLPFQAFADVETVQIIVNLDGTNVHVIHGTTDENAVVQLNDWEALVRMQPNLTSATLVGWYWIDGAPVSGTETVTGDNWEIVARFTKGSSTPDPEPEPEVPADITWQIKHVAGGDVVNSGSFTPKGETAVAKDILYYHVFNKTTAWKEEYTVDKVYSSKAGTDVGYNGEIPAGDTVTFVLTAIEAEEPEDLTQYYKVTFSVNKDGNSSSFSRTYEKDTVISLNAALVNEVAFGAACVEWVVNGTNVVNGATVTVTGPMTISCSITNNKTETTFISLYPNGGQLQSYVSGLYPVVKGQHYGNLPVPSRDGYTFAYWYYLNSNGNEVRVYNEDIVENTYPLYAKWIKNGVTVTFQRYDLTYGWVNVEDHTVPYGSVLTVRDGTFPSNTNAYKIEGFDIKGWKVASTGETFYADYVVVTENITLRPKYQGYVTLVAQEPETGASWKTHKVLLEIGEVIGELTNPGSRSNYIFDGWLASNGSTLICDRFCDSELKFYPHEIGTTFYAKWEGGITVRLHIHTDGDTANADKIVPYYVAPATGVFDLKVINMYSIFSDYYKYDDSCDKQYGWYDVTEWKNYCANRASHPATSFTNIQRNGQFDFHIMLINNGEDSYSSSGVADSSNPKTGDAIFAPVMILGASAAALAALFFLNKKRAF